MKCCKYNHYRPIQLVDRVLPDDGRIDNEDLSAVFPVDPATNLPISDLDLINRSDTPQAIKEALDPNFVRLPNVDVGIDEETKSITLRPRNCQSFAEVSRFGRALQQYADSQNQQSVKQPLNGQLSNEQITAHEHSSDQPVE